MIRTYFQGRRVGGMMTCGMLLLFGWIMVNCGGKPAVTEQAAIQNDSSALQATNEVLQSLRESGITRQFSADGSVFQAEAVHDINKSHDYLHQSNKAAAAIRLGIYMSDLGYLMEFDRRDQAKRYFEECLLLANHVGLQELFSKAVEVRFSDIISGNADLQRDLGRLFKHATNTAAADEFKKIHAAALAGYYIEELYHLTLFIQTAPQQENLSPLRMKALQTLLSQKDEVGNLIRYFDHLELKPEGIALYQEYLKMQSGYQSLDADRLLKETNEMIILQDKKFNEILASIISIRNRIAGS
jgi:hypothetical protein